MTSVATQRAINVLDPQFYVDPWQAYRWLRDEAPVYWDPAQKVWAISRYRDVRDIETDTQRYSSSGGSRPHTDQREDMSMINMDDPQHQDQRRLVFRRFTPRAMRSHEAHVRAVVTEILDQVVPLGQCEAIEAIASRLPAIMISDLLGYPRELWERVRYWSEQTMVLAGQTSPNGPPHVVHPGIPPVMQEFAETTIELIKARRAEPRDDLISVWTHTPGWDTKHILDETILVLDGGAETTRTVIGSMIRELALQLDQRRILLERPGLLATTAVEEFIRWVSPILNMRRTATAGHELHGRHIRAGDEILLLYAAANRDPRAFPHPDVLNVTRSPNRHLAFGAGTHLCLGAHLARLEIRVMTEELLRRMPDWELTDPGEPQIGPATFTRAYDRIRIRFTPTRLAGLPGGAIKVSRMARRRMGSRLCKGSEEHNGWRIVVAASTERLHVGPRDHIVQFYSHDAELVERVGDYLLGAVLDGGVAIVIATAGHRAAFAARLADAGVDVAAAVERGAYLAFDASETVGRFMVAGRPDGAGFEEVVGTLIQRAVQRGAPVRAYGEMVALLWESGLVGAAIELEALWNGLGRLHPFSLFCAYPAQSVAGNGHFDAFNEVCLLHAGIVGDSPAAAETRVFALAKNAPAEARHFAVGAVRRLGAGHLAGDVALVVTEFAANAILHARSGFTVALSCGEDVVRISVRDGSGLSGSGLPTAPLHGLGAVAALARQWGVVPLGDDGKTVWAELPR